MFTNARDWKTTIPAILFAGVIFGLGILKVYHPELDGPIDSFKSALSYIGAGAVVGGVRSGQ